ncbi:membrane-bound PQQ-dependent dehydrogenase, glucose/quinate/shikimate family [Sphingomonadales bacterium 56]|uniref:membrane-bound PQQ-dependent dehydrogenase, glucose/quinate/shikimate family n=1 Tax=unclassified Sphingobium TaxID=2611147 RepID=UPI00191A8CE2|nr:MULTISPECIES: membrane-bound PQQ-dependent dehydrogenase, glucose/quinate/shikimate family [unclassified Sphingobium]MBY2929977.1 membrane-bound PQQ-dependent dehydrogenase, glucose/quinate/shikimate family [Sphingomonadales bacterium 56]MBY2959774.1 membrane-bound PQQ-dependent dehydrogenase, glucose/quinate/shikimate family [Sphingomonadales bacterium 58]CAD7339777.1 Quinate/shikimate dehydrogenase (quinone) [Sphingobium sp. S8]CAD7340529.1 Quinate/shikimate dehydrogenase (quinone) [Sphing
MPVDPTGSGAQSKSAPSRLLLSVCRLLGALLVLVGLILLLGGAWLVLLGGTPYYLVSGAALALSGGLLARARVASFWVFAAAYAGTIIWAFAEAGLNFWPQLPRLGPFLVMGVIMASLWGWLVPPMRRAARSAMAMQLLVIGAGIGAMFLPHGVIHSAEARADGLNGVNTPAWQWRSYGGDTGAGHFAPFTQINRDNVSQLKPAWIFRTGEINDSPDMQATPIQVGSNLYFCTAHNRIFAVDGDTGRRVWSFDPHVRSDGTWNRCRGVAFYEAAPSPAGAKAEGNCARRILATTIDARLIALDAANGQLCRDFGRNGQVDLTAGLGEMKPGWYYPTSAPLVARGKVIVGGWISDNQSVDEPGGVVRAFDAVTGRLDWAWDPGRKVGQQQPGSAQDQSVKFARSTPNFWGTATFDEQLGLVYVPTGNGTSDHWGGMRSPETDRYSTSVIAIDVETGRLVWHYQTVHHDLWDWDLSAPPAFVNMPDGRGGLVPALVQVGKAGQIYVLDRRNGRPVTPVVERPVPQTAAPGDYLSPTQPYSVGMPQLIPQRLKERDMWGLTFFDQLACRIAYRKLHYEGQYTPPGERDTLIWPGYLGGMNWGGVAIDPARKLLMVNDIRLSTIVRLVRRKDVEGKVQANFSHAGYELHPVKGAPFGVELKSFLSLLGLPCEQPPWGKITAIDLQSRRVRWQVPAGTGLEQTFNLAGVELPVKLGMPSISSTMMTASGLVFYAGANDPFLRAWNSASGRELWRARLPAGSQATPMSYLSPRTGRQYVVVAAGGTPYSARVGDYVVAYALPR